MKKNLFGLLAIVIAIGAVAFTTPEKRFAAKFFEFQGTLTSQIDVQDVDGNWVEVANIGTCNLTLHKACRVQVDELNTTVSGGIRKIDPTKVTFTASLFATDGTYYVSASTGTQQVRNKN